MLFLEFCKAYCILLKMLNHCQCILLKLVICAGIFHQSTIFTLEMHSDEIPALLETSRLLKFIGNIWKILSVKSKFKGNVVFISIAMSKTSNKQTSICSAFLV